MGSFAWFWGFQPSAFHPEIQSHMSDNNNVFILFSMSFCPTLHLKPTPYKKRCAFLLILNDL